MNSQAEEKEKKKPAVPFIHILGNCFFPVLDSDMGTCIFSSWTFFHHTSPVHPSAHQGESLSSICSPRREGLSLSPPQGLGQAKERLQTARAPSRKPQEPSHGGHGTVPLCVFKASLLPTSVKAAGTWHFCKSDFQVFSRHSE